MIQVKYSDEGIRIDVGEISKYNQNLPLRVKIMKHVSGEEVWSTELNDFWFATFPSTEMFDVEVIDNKNTIVYTKKWDIMEHGNHFYKSLWLYNKMILSNGKFPKGLVIGTHDGEFGEWVPIALKREANMILVEASNNQFSKLLKNYYKNSTTKCIQNLVTTNGEDVIFFEGGAGYTNTVVEKVIRYWETEEVHTTKRSSISMTNLIMEEIGGDIDWLHLDVEGLDAKLIMSIDESKIKLPNFIIFEDFNLNEDEKREIYSYLEKRNYKLKSEGGICEAIRK